MYIDRVHCHNCSHHCQTAGGMSTASRKCSPPITKRTVLPSLMSSFCQGPITSSKEHCSWSFKRVAVDSIRYNIDFLKVESLQKGMFNSFVLSL